MNLIERTTFNQPKVSSPNESLCRDLKQAIKVINAEYQHIDWEDQDFLTRVLYDALEALEQGELYANR